MRLITDDDEVLWGTFTLLRECPQVIVVLRSHAQERFGVSHQERESETARAMSLLGCTWEQWDFRDDNPDWATITRRLAERLGPRTKVYAPAWEENGHDHHNRLSEIAGEMVTADCLTRYVTYTMAPYRKSRTDFPVAFEREWIGRKLEALACYRSQMRANGGSHQPFLDDLREYVL